MEEPQPEWNIVKSWKNYELSTAWTAVFDG